MPGTSQKQTQMHRGEGSIHSIDTAVPRGSLTSSPPPPPALSAPSDPRGGQGGPPCGRLQDGPLDPAPVDRVSRGPNRHRETRVSMATGVSMATLSLSMSTPGSTLQGETERAGAQEPRGFEGVRAQSRGKAGKADRVHLGMAQAHKVVWWWFSESEKNSASHSDTFPPELTETVWISNDGLRPSDRRPTF